jgi:hypothetical protein
MFVTLSSWSIQFSLLALGNGVAGLRRGEEGPILFMQGNMKVTGRYVCGYITGRLLWRYGFVLH